NKITLDDRVGISVPGQSGLAKFFKPPPVDAAKIPAIVRFEAKQQIPFPLEEVIWDFQKMVGGQEVDGFVIDAEVGLFAMKREQVHRYLKPFEKADIALDIVQLAPISIYNFVGYDILVDGPSEDMFDPDDPPESVVVLSMGTDATDLVITNGFRMWQRSIPLGGNHFTKQLTKEMKLTFAKAEHLKRNARQAEDPKAVFQAMRPIFNDVVTEVQRSIGFFQGLDRKAKIKGVVLLGNTVKLPGLQQYVAKNLGYEVMSFEKFNRLEGSSVISAPAFTDNVLAFGVCYGLCLQTLGESRLKTSLLPREILTRRLVKAKKPWAVASAGALMLALSLNFAFTYRVQSEVDENRTENNVSWKQAEGAVASVNTLSSGHEATHKTKLEQISFAEKIGEEVVGADDRRVLWLEMLKAIDSALPWTEGVVPGEYVDFKKLPMDQRKELHLEYIESEYFPDVATWWTTEVANRHYELDRELSPTAALAADAAAAPGAAPAADAAAPAADDAAAATETSAEASTDTSETGDGGEAPAGGPTGPGWIIEMSGYHYFNSNIKSGGAVHVRNTLLRNLREGKVQLPIDHGRKSETFTMEELGILLPILAMDDGQPRKVQVPNPDFDPKSMNMMGMPGMAGGMGDGGMGMPGMGMPGMGMPGMGMPGMSASGGMMPGGAGGYGRPAGGGENGNQTGDDAKKLKENETPPFFTVNKYSFVIQFCWQPKRINERLKAREEKLKAAAAAAAAATDAGTDAAADGVPADGAPVEGAPADGAPAAAGAPAAGAPAAGAPAAGAPAAVAPAAGVPADGLPAGAAPDGGAAPINEAGKGN
ncbi:MAG: pilus assembly protein PilM, partial [Pirellulaceae bacterium]